MPNPNTSGRQRRTAAIPLAFHASGTWNGCNPNTVMSINWRASLVPAAAVIPAPRAYTNIAAVKTPVVCHWVAGPLGGRRCARCPHVTGEATSVVLRWERWGPRARWDTTPSGMAPRPLPTKGSLTVRTAPAESPLQWGSTRYHPGRLCATSRVGGWGPPPAPHVHEATACVHLRSPPLQTPWKTQCAPSSLSL